MPELGKYAATVLGAYGIGLALLAGIVGLSLWQARRMSARLKAAEARLARAGQGDG